MKKTYIYEGDKIPTGNGYLEIVLQHYNIGAYVDVYETDEEGNYIKTESKSLYHKQDICSSWKESDGNNHEIIIEKARFLYTISSPSGPIDTAEGGEDYTIADYLEECEINGCDYEHPEGLTIDAGEQIIQDFT